MSDDDERRLMGGLIPHVRGEIVSRSTSLVSRGLHLLKGLPTENATVAEPSRGHVAPGIESRQAVEMLPMLKAKYPGYIRPEVTSVVFGQTRDRCYLEIHTTETLAGYLRNEVIKRDDLAFISDGADDVGDCRLFFDPSRPITQNVHRFISEFDETDIINCTDLFSPESKRMV